jgi:hypothetical protein
MPTRCRQSACRWLIRRNSAQCRAVLDHGAPRPGGEDHRAVPAVEPWDSPAIGGLGRPLGPPGAGPQGDDHHASHPRTRHRAAGCQCRPGRLRPRPTRPQRHPGQPASSLSGAQTRMGPLSCRFTGRVLGMVAPLPPRLGDHPDALARPFHEVAGGRLGGQATGGRSGSLAWSDGRQARGDWLRTAGGAWASAG